jgi:ABC-type Fe3+/spermidine/putrescine transport system ATPase subunit
MSAVSIVGVTKVFEKTRAVHIERLDIPSGQFFSILGPSGCGKTTLLRMIAGFESPTSGRILVNGEDITEEPPQDRGIGMVFQTYALFPHMTVFGNVAFGLEVRKVQKEEIRRRVREALEAVDLVRKIDEQVPRLSGGEQQRVAVARALVLQPSILLFDEPLSNLDVSLRVKTREEIRALQRRTGITTVYVTHDQEEAMSLSDRIAVMRDGALEQVGSPEEVYEQPVNPFVARFLGGANLVEGHYTDKRFTAGKLVVNVQGLSEVPVGNATLSIRHEAIIVLSQKNAGTMSAVVQEKEYLGFTTNLILLLNGLEVHSSMVSSTFSNHLLVGDTVWIRFDMDMVKLFPGWWS